MIRDNLRFKEGMLSFTNEQGDSVFVPQEIFTVEEQLLADAYVEEHKDDVPEVIVPTIQPPSIEERVAAMEDMTMALLEMLA